MQRWIKPEFIGSFTDVQDIPIPRDSSGHVMPEIALVGRSNAGKSSLLNALTNTRKLAKCSKEPGKTRTLNLFTINSWLSIMDLPGYGYAKISMAEKALWEKQILSYLKKRKPLTGIVLAMDIRRKLTEDEYAILNLAQQNGVEHVALVVTKADKLSKNELLRTHEMLHKTMMSFQKEASLSLSIAIHIVSSTTGYGIQGLKQYFATISST